MSDTRLLLLISLCLSVALSAVPSTALKSSFGSTGFDGTVSSTSSYSLDSSASLRMEASLGDGFLVQRGHASGRGENSIHQTVSGGVASVQGSVASEGSFSLQLSSQAIDYGAGLIQGVSGSGDLVAGIQCQSGIFAAQSAAVVGGDLQTEQAVSAGVGVLASQDTDISGQTGRIGSQTLSSKDQMRVWGSFQGQGRLEADLSAGSAVGSSVDGQVRVDGVEWMGSEELSRLARSNQGLAVQGLRAVEDGVGTFGVVAESRASAGGQVATQALGGSPSSYAFTEPKWRWNTRDPKIQLYLRTDSLLTGEGLTYDQAQAAITAAANTWDDAVGQNLFADGTTVIPSSTVRADYPYDWVNVHAWKRLTNAPGALAYSRTRYDVPVVDGYYSVLESDVSYNTDVSWSTNLADGTPRTAGQPFDVQTVALHELGHTIGLGDLYTLPSTDPRYSDWGQIMNSYDDVQRSLGSGDRTGATELYGSPSQRHISLRINNGKFLVAEGGGARELLANRDWMGAWETFGLVDLGGGSVALQAQNGQYVCAEGGGGDQVVANRNAIGPWETFRLLQLADKFIAIQAQNGQYVSAEGSGGNQVVANRDAIGAWETFRLIDHDESSINLQAYNGQYVCAEGGGGGEVVADRLVAAQWETFNFIDMGDENVALKSYYGQYLCAEGGGGREIVANRPWVGPWEMFRKTSLQDGKIILQSYNGQYICAEGGGGGYIVANRNIAGPWEVFTLQTSSIQ